MEVWHMNNISVKGIVLGIVVGNVAYITLGLIFALLSSPLFCSNISEKALATILMLFSLLFGAASMVAGGYTTARVAKDATYLNSGIFGVIVVILGLLFGGERPLPIWFIVLSYISILPSALLGGHLAGPRQTSYA
jgi:hypothetical protein